MPDSTRLDRPAVVASWALYDLANTVFSFQAVTYALPLYINEMVGMATPIGVANTVSMLLVGLLVPALGALSDRTGRSKAYTLLATVVCIGFFAALSMPVQTWGLSPAWQAALVLGCFAAANVAYQVSLVYYNSLLPVVASEARQGFVSGLGVGLGYLGSILALGAALLVHNGLSWGDTVYVQGTGSWQWSFAAGAALFAVFSVPMLLVPERRVEAPARLTWGLFKETWTGVLATVRSLPATPALMFFLIGNFLVVDAMHAGIVYFALYLQEVGGMSATQSGAVLLGFNLLAAPFGLAMGVITDRLGAAETYLLACLSFVAALVLCTLALDPWIIVAALLAFGPPAIAGLWVAGRKLLVQLAPKGRAGEFFGFYGLTNKVSALGALYFGVVADLMGYRWALFGLLAFVLPGMMLLAPLSPAAMRVFRDFVVRPFFWAYLRLFHRFRVKGLEHIPAEGPAVLAGNHQAYYDPVLGNLAVRREVLWMAWARLFRVPVLGYFLRAAGAFPVDTEGAGRDTIRNARQALEEGHIMGIFPEAGRADLGGKLAPFKAGALRFASMLQAPIVPFVLEGAYRAWPKTRRFPRPGRITVAYKPALPPPSDYKDKDQVQAATDALRRVMERRLVPALRAEERRERLYRGRPWSPRLREALPLLAAVLAPAHQAWVAGVAALAYLWLAADQVLLPRRAWTKAARWAVVPAFLLLAFPPLASAAWSNAAWANAVWAGQASGGAGLADGLLAAVLLATALLVLPGYSPVNGARFQNALSLAAALWLAATAWPAWSGSEANAAWLQGLGLPASWTGADLLGGVGPLPVLAACFAAATARLPRLYGRGFWSLAAMGLALEEVFRWGALWPGAWPAVLLGLAAAVLALPWRYRPRNAFAGPGPGRRAG